ncbi:hypothetical protein BpHYR1_010946 [Brachionus plicatilis]|uniref:Uncharacterized protein n=1 Tax=Brachionus plicatilis TaxID=10195 RepID=A0A3M7T7Z8_BRAPC|nr:hypothetical protein BpHYR1_010946 [Brachionus plicatilis]
MPFTCSYSCTFFLIKDMTAMRVSTCCRDMPSRGTPSANVCCCWLSTQGSHKCRMNMAVYALNSLSVLPLRSRDIHWELKTSWGGMPNRMMPFR